MLTREEVLKIANLARLELSEDEVQLYQKRLTRVLDYVKELSELKTDQAFVRHVPKEATNFKQDAAEPFTAVEELMKNAPALEHGAFLIPTVVEHS